MKHMGQSLSLAVASAILVATASHAQSPSATPAPKPSQPYRDARFGVRFRVPSGWDLTRYAEVAAQRA